MRLSPTNIPLIFNEFSMDFPLFERAMEFILHEEKMIRISSRTVILNILKINDPAALKWILTKKSYFSNHGIYSFVPCHYITSLVKGLMNGINQLGTISQATHNSFISDKLEEILDQLLYVYDIMSLRVSQSVIDHLFEVLIDDFLIPLWIEFIVKCEGNQVRNVTILELYSLEIWFL